jgi:hypothetical protein
MKYVHHCNYEIDKKFAGGHFNVIHHCIYHAMGDPFTIKSINGSVLAKDLDRVLPKIIHHGALLDPDRLD